MATIRVADGWAPDIIDILLNQVVGPPTVNYHAFDNNLTPTPASVLGDFNEVTAAGYGAATVTGATWTPATTPSGTTIATAPTFAWTLTAAVTIYGYYCTDSTNLVLFWSQRFDTPIVISGLGGTITVEPTFEIITPIT